MSTVNKSTSRTFHCTSRTQRERELRKKKGKRAALPRHAHASGAPRPGSGARHSALLLHLHPVRVPTQKERKTSKLRVPKNVFANVRKGWKQCKQRERRKTLQASKRQTHRSFGFYSREGV